MSNKKNVREKTVVSERKTDPKILFPKPGNFLYPVPAVMVSCAPKGYHFGQDRNAGQRVSPGEKGKVCSAPDRKENRPNIITVAWAGTVCSDPPMVSISVRKERYSHALIKESGEFVINLTNRAMTKACDYCGCTSGAKVDKFKECRLTPCKSTKVAAPGIEEAPVNIECKVRQIIPLGSHDLFLAEVVAVQAGSEYLDEKGAFHMEETDLMAYSHGKYYALGKLLGSFGYSVRKKTSRSGKKRSREQAKES